MSFTHTLASGKVTNDVLSFNVVATDTVSHAISAPVTATVTFTPLPDFDTITIADYRISRQRLAITATSSVVSPNVVLSLMPYRTTTGALFDPATVGSTMTNNGGGNYTLTLVGVPQPGFTFTPLTVQSNIGGTSPPTALTSVRP